VERVVSRRKIPPLNSEEALSAVKRVACDSLELYTILGVAVSLECLSESLLLPSRTEFKTQRTFCVLCFVTCDDGLPCRG
jgi:hypothetical protein